MKLIEIEIELETVEPELEKLGLQTHNIYKNKVFVNTEHIEYLRQEGDKLYILLTGREAEIRVFDGKDKLLSMCKEI